MEELYCHCSQRGVKLMIVTLLRSVDHYFGSFRIANLSIHTQCIVFRRGRKDLLIR